MRNQTLVSLMIDRDTYNYTTKDALDNYWFLSAFNQTLKPLSAI